MKNKRQTRANIKTLVAIKNVLKSQGHSFSKSTPTHKEILNAACDRYGVDHCLPKNSKIEALINAIPNYVEAKKTIKKSDWTKAFYQSYAWRSVRLDVLLAKGRKCAICGATPETGAVMNVDHIMPLRLFPDLKLDKTNLQVLCEECNHGKANKILGDIKQSA